METSDEKIKNTSIRVQDGSIKYKPLERLNKKLTVEILYIWVLSLLKEEKKYAYELRSEIKQKYGFTPAMITSYHVLYKLEKEKYVSSLKQTLTPNRRYYEITAKGLKLIEETRLFFQSIYSTLFG